VVLKDRGNRVCTTWFIKLCCISAIFVVRLVRMIMSRVIRVVYVRRVGRRCEDA
jgi:hypothetical protein